ncbi:spermidine/putrescine transport system ATP-binding protein [Plasticicumulans lactativorans]|uniref:Spermidine/putrescine import ATP-binding protein PotA n=1 Tax=Plasticicumulans lactativorans TaxID=1133106 RepID=A0A4R2LPI4_9GAMM|nr:spermidine/putrescine ABC transporter ATP-binding protein PotA [Plasticicumulans lactativorans]TCO81425.1 spermidine/putrescine transport system ATP-binding protein [Plasticicumulans lactativorans]
MSEFVIEVKGATKTYGKNTVLHGVDLQVRRGEFLTLLGPSGCGKTTILRLLAGFETPTSGQVILDGKDVSHDPPEERHVNTVFQSYALFPHMTVFDNVAFGPRIQGVNGADLEGRVMEALRTVKLDSFAQRRPDQLSGGQQQRVAIARALVNKPLVLLLDESLSALDYKLRKAMQIELKQLQRQLGITFVFVTHDQEEALSMSDRVVVMNTGTIQQIGTPREVYETPANLFVAKFVGEINLLEASVAAVHGDGRYTIDIHGRRFELGARRSFAAQQAVNVLVRPEDLRIWRAGEPRAEDVAQTIEATVEEVIYKGSTVDLMVRLATGEALSATQFFNEDDPVFGNLDYKRGERVEVDWVPGWEVILPHD